MHSYPKKGPHATRNNRRQPEEKEILNVRRLPARLNAEQTAALLGLSSHDIPVLVSAKLLRPLGKPVPNAAKWFAGCVTDAGGDV